MARTHADDYPRGVWVAEDGALCFDVVEVCHGLGVAATPANQELIDVQVRQAFAAIGGDSSNVEVVNRITRRADAPLAACGIGWPVCPVCPGQGVQLRRGGDLPDVSDLLAGRRGRPVPVAADDVAVRRRADPDERGAAGVRQPRCAPQRRAPAEGGGVMRQVMLPRPGGPVVVAGPSVCERCGGSGPRPVDVAVLRPDAPVVCEACRRARAGAGQLRWPAYLACGNCGGVHVGLHMAGGPVGLCCRCAPSCERGHDVVVCRDGVCEVCHPVPVGGGSS